MKTNFITSSSSLPHDLPTRGLVLVFGEAMSGKDACVGNAILRDSAQRKFEVVILSEAQVAFGNRWPEQANDSFASAAKIQALMERYLVVLITQSHHTTTVCSGTAAGVKERGNDGWQHGVSASTPALRTNLELLRP